jgi:hypothetical protein
MEKQQKPKCRVCNNCGACLTSRVPYIQLPARIMPGQIKFTRKQTYPEKVAQIGGLKRNKHLIPNYKGVYSHKTLNGLIK